MRYLVVANRTLGGDHLLRLLAERLDRQPGTVHIVVPSTPDPSGWVNDEGANRTLAKRRLASARERIAGLGAEVTGEIGDERPFDAVMDVLRREPFDEVIVSTLPPTVSRWLRMDLVSHLERAVSIPVTHVIAADADVLAG